MSRLAWMRLAQPLMARFPGVAYRLASAAGWLAWTFRRDLRRRVTRNLRPLCGGDRERARREGLQAVQNVARYFVDLASLPRRDMARFEAEHLEVFHAERLEMLNEPDPVIIVSAHCGNAELAIQAIGHRGRPFVALVEAQEPPEWSAYMLGLRTANGAGFVEANSDGLRVAIRALRDGQVLGLMADRDLQGTGVCVELFGQAAKLPRGPWDLALRHNARVVPIFSSRKRRDQFRVWVGEPFTIEAENGREAAIEAAARHYAALLERHLRRDPGQWLVLEDFWRNHRCG
jgi:phosphatidylinositol dimannoside acyltransferase